MARNRKQKRKFLDHFASEHLQPSKYLLITPGDDENIITKLSADHEDQTSTAIDEVNHNIENFNNSNDHTNHKIALLDIGSDCLLEIIKFLDFDNNFAMMKVCKVFSRVIIPFFMDETEEVYENKEHLQSLREQMEDLDNGNHRDGLFSECGTWKLSLFSNDDVLLDDEQWSDDDDVLECNDCTFQRKLIPFGSPLCRGTIQDQFWLVQENIYLESYKKLVEMELGIKEEEQGLYEINPLVFKEKIDREKGMIDSYINDVQESIHVDCGNPIWISYDYPIYSDDERFDICQIEYPHIAFHALRSGISRLSKQAGVLLFEPQIMEDMFYQLKKFIYLIIKDAYETKFPNKREELDFDETLEQYSRYCVDPVDTDLACFDDDLDTDKKLSEHDIISSYKKLTGKSLLFGKENDPYRLKEYRDTSMDSDNTPNTEEESSSDDYSSEDDETEEEEHNLENITDFEELMQKLPVDEFIDDSFTFDFDLDNLGETLPEQLMKVSIRVHEEIYGKERAHNEKLYLKNWYGNGDLFFKNCSKQLDNPQQPALSEASQQEESQSNCYIDGLSNEKSIIEIDMKEDLEYFGYSLYEDEFEEFPILMDEDSDLENEQATEEESLEYQLRRMLREQSYECIVNYFEG